MSHKLLVIGGTDLPLVASAEGVSSRINRQIHLLRSSMAAITGGDSLANGSAAPDIKALYFAPDEQGPPGRDSRVVQHCESACDDPFSVHVLHCPMVPVPGIHEDPGEASGDTQSEIHLPYPLLWQRKEIDRQVRTLLHETRWTEGRRLIIHAHTAGAIGLTLRDIAKKRSLPFIATHHFDYQHYVEGQVNHLLGRLRDDPRLTFSQLTRSGGLLADVFPALVEDQELLERVQTIVNAFREIHERLVIHGDEGNKRWGRFLLASAQLFSRYAFNRVSGARAVAQIAVQLDALSQAVMDRDDGLRENVKLPQWFGLEPALREAARSLVHAYLQWFYSACELVIVDGTDGGSTLRQEIPIDERRVRNIPLRQEQWLSEFYRVNLEALERNERQVRRPRVKPIDEISFAKGNSLGELEPFVALSDAHLGDDDPVDRAMAMDALFEVAAKLGISMICYNGDFGDLSANPNKLVNHRDMFNHVRARWVNTVPRDVLPDDLRAVVSIPSLENGEIPAARRAAIMKQFKKVGMRLGLEIEINGLPVGADLKSKARDTLGRKVFDELFIPGNHDEGLDPAVLLPGCKVAENLAHYDRRTGAVFTHGHILGLPEFFDALRSGQSIDETIGMLRERELGQSLENASMFHDLATSVWRKSERYVNVRTLWKQTFQPPVSRFVQWLRSARTDSVLRRDEAEGANDEFFHFLESTISPADDVQAAAQFAAAMHRESSPCWISVYGHSHKDDLQKVMTSNPSTGQKSTKIVANCGKFHGKPTTCLVARFPEAIIARWSSKDRVWRVHKRISLTEAEAAHVLNGQSSAELPMPAKSERRRPTVKAAQLESGTIICEVPTEGDGHITRFDALYPLFKQVGTVCTIVSGPRAATIELPGGIHYRCTGLALEYDPNGAVDRWRSGRGIARSLMRVRAEARQLAPILENFRYVISDFGPTLKLAHDHAEKVARRNGKSNRLPPLINSSHQAALDSLQRDVPRPSGEFCSRANVWIGQRAIDLLRGDRNIGFHYEQYNENILPPLIRPDMIDAEALHDGDFVLVYVRGALEALAETLDSVRLPVDWRIYTHRVDRETKLSQRVWAMPRDRRKFRDDLLHCAGLFADCGFGLTSEALHFGIPFVGRPLPNHFEQQCNAAALEEISDVGIIYDLKSNDAQDILRNTFGPTAKDRTRLARSGRLGEIGPYCGIAEKTAAKLFED